MKRTVNSIISYDIVKLKEERPSTHGPMKVQISKCRFCDFLFVMNKRNITILFAMFDIQMKYGLTPGCHYYGGPVLLVKILRFIYLGSSSMLTSEISDIFKISNYNILIYNTILKILTDLILLKDFPSFFIHYVKILSAQNSL